MVTIAIVAALGGCSTRDAQTDAGIVPAVDGGNSAPDASHAAGPSCDNGVRDGNESSLDCGGSDCDPCEHGRSCMDGTDCAGGVCMRGFCLVPSCMDGVTNGDETGIDCGGDCGLCPAGEPCTSNAECASRHCLGGGTCGEASCTDSVRNADESDVDCGGSCPACDAGGTCGEDEDCASRLCDDEGRCTEAGCSDRIRNQDETATDCGGVACSPCRDGLACVVGSDCDSGNCEEMTCVP